MTLLLQADHLQTIQHHATQTYPEEGCGLMLGIRNALHANGEHPKNQVFEIYPTLNVWDLDNQDLEHRDLDNRDLDNRDLDNRDLDNTEPNTGGQNPDQDTTAHRRYQIDSTAMIQAQQYARSNGWDIIGIYHSHPDHPAVPSEWDRAWAWPQYSYVIVSVEKGIARDLQSWTLDETCHEFLPEKLVVVGTTPPQVMPNLEE